MIRSMTGYGAGSGSAGGWNAAVALRTLNHRYLSVRVRGASDPVLERKIDEEVKHAFARGEVEVTVSLTQDPDALRLRFDRRTISAYADELRALADELSLPPPSLHDLISLGAFAPQAAEVPDPWPAVAAALTAAIVGAQAARTQEGKLIHDELVSLLDELSSLIDQVKARIPAVVEELRDRLRERVSSLGVEVDPDRLEMELALLAERADVREEIARLEAHVSRIRTLLDSDAPVGKELSFLAQELLREANTLGAKSRDLEINGLVVSMKVAIDRFKEQVQNVE